MISLLVLTLWQICRRVPAMLAGIVLLGVGLRGAVIAFHFDQLSVDTDAYLAIAERLLAGDGYCSVAGQPTAFRPPLFPLLVALTTGIGGPLGLAVLHVGLGIVTITLTWWLARRLELEPRYAGLAALAVAVDPMLLAYSCQAMTEVLMTTLTIGFFATVWLPRSAWVRGSLAGALWGLLALCRPSIWPFAALVGAWLVAERLLKRSKLPLNWREWVAGGIVATLVLLPWGLRNVRVLDAFVLTTTHGGYTAILGNNDAFYRDVVEQPFGTQWNMSQLVAWQSQLEAELDQRGISRSDEVARDAAMKQLAMQWIRDNPSRFLWSAWHRQRNLWSPVPLNQPAQLSWLVWLVGTGYCLLGLLAVRGIVASQLDPRFRRLSLLLVLSLAGLHCVFWANARMRAPLVPVIAVLAATGARQVCQCRLRQKATDP